MIGPMSSIAWVVARCAKGASCPWWDSDAGPSLLVIIGGALVLVAFVLFVNWIRSR